MSCIRIDPDGAVAVVEGNALDVARAEFTHCTVVACSAPFLPPDSTWVLCVDDFGAEDQPLNRRAWGCYGRSPIFGVAFLGRDGGGTIPAGLAHVIGKDIREWPIDAAVAEFLMTNEPERPGMLVRREDASGT